MEQWEQIFDRIYGTKCINPWEKVLFNRGWDSALETVTDINTMAVEEIADYLLDNFDEDDMVAFYHRLEEK